MHISWSFETPLCTRAPLHPTMSLVISISCHSTLESHRPLERRVYTPNRFQMSWLRSHICHIPCDSTRTSHEIWPQGCRKQRIKNGRGESSLQIHKKVFYQEAKQWVYKHYRNLVFSIIQDAQISVSHVRRQTSTTQLKSLLHDPDYAIRRVSCSKLSMIFLKNFKVLTWSFYHHHSHPFPENLHSDTGVGAAAHQIPTLHEGLQAKPTSCVLDLHTPQLAGNSFQTSVC